jgi:hypothetical protein
MATLNNQRVNLFIYVQIIFLEKAMGKLPAAQRRSPALQGFDPLQLPKGFTPLAAAHVSGKWEVG